MRPVAIAQDVLRHPLNDHFGTRSNVRLLRVLATEVDGPLTAADAARRAGLSVPGAQKALTSLTQAGFLTRVGGGRRYLYEIRSSDPFMRAAAAVFQAEKNRYDALLHRLKQAVESLAPPPHAAWIKQVPQNAGDPLTISLLHSSPGSCRVAVHSGTLPDGPPFAISCIFQRKIQTAAPEQSIFCGAEPG